MAKRKKINFAAWSISVPDGRACVESHIRRYDKSGMDLYRTRRRTKEDCEGADETPIKLRIIEEADYRDLLRRAGE